VTDKAAVPVFDGHNDALFRLFNADTPTPESRFLDGDAGHVDLPRAVAGHLAGGFFAVFCPSKANAQMGEAMKGASYDVPLPEPLPLAEAQAMTLRMTSMLLRIERMSEGRVALCRTAAEIRAAMAKGALATVLHIEGAEGIDPEFRALDVLYAAGLRSIGPVWSRPNIFGHGVPFRFPGDPDTGPGLTDLGRELVRLCNERRMVIDLSHITEAGFWDVAKLSDAPLVATHSNVHALCTVTRNLTSRQLDAVAERRGVVGLNYATSFLRPDGMMRADTGLDIMLRHLDAMLERLGEDGVALGSDFDGAVIPSVIGDCAGNPRLIEAMRAHGYGEALVEKIAWRNWVDLLERTWGA
jgi:membrane dipeptidase